MPVLTGSKLLLADACWIAVAQLHIRYPERDSFSAAEIAKHMQAEELTAYSRTSIGAHLTQHCVANVPPTSGRYRMLTREFDGRLRLYRQGDDVDGARKGKIHPKPEDLPDNFRHLLNWYESDYLLRRSQVIDPVLAMEGVGRDVWQGIDTDNYVADLRSGWIDR